MERLIASNEFGRTRLSCRVLAATMVVWGALTLVLPFQSAAGSKTTEEYVRSEGARLLESVKKGSLSTEELFDDFFVPNIDIAAFSETVIGKPRWARASKEERELVQGALLHHLEVRYQKTLEDYAQLERFIVLEVSLVSETECLVTIVVERSGSEPTTLVWRIREPASGGHPLAIDIIKEDFSAAITFYDDARQSLARGGISAYLEELEAKRVELLAGD